MRWLTAVAARLRSLFRRDRLERELDAELRFHLDQQIAENLQAGMSPSAARLSALRSTGSISGIKDQCRESLGLRLIDELRQDVRYSARTLIKNPGFTIVAVLTLALGIGANTALFSLVNATLFQRLPLANRDRLTYVYRGGVGGVFAYPMYAHLRDGNHVFDGFAAWGGITASLHAGEAAELAGGLIVTGNFFSVLGVHTGVGRLIGPADDVTPGAHPVAVLSHDFWQARFARRPDIVGREIRLNGQSFTIIGVTPAGFPGPQLGPPPNLYVPMMMQAIMRPPRAGYSGEQNPDLLTHPTNSWLFGIARLKPGVGTEEARAELDTLATAYLQTLPQPPATPRIALVPLDQGALTQRQQMQAAALLLGGVVGAVLLIACANIANMVLSRSVARRRELAVRLALGASRLRLVRQLLTESVLLSMMGGLAGVSLAWALLEAFKAAPPPPATLPPISFSIDHRVLAFSLTLSCLTGIIFGAIPSLKASRPGLVPALKDGSVETDERGRRFNLKKALVVAEVGLSLVLLIAAGLFVRSLQSAHAINPGFETGKLLNAPLNINLLRYTRVQGRAFYREVIERVERLPGVQSASVARVAPLTFGARILSFHVEGRPALHGRQRAEGSRLDATRSPERINANVVGPRFFGTLGIPLIAGRDFSDRDVEGPPVIILNQTAARMHFPAGDSFGRRVSVDGPDGPWREIVGVVGDSKYSTLGEGDVPVAYMPLAQNHETGMTLYVRTSMPPESLIAAVRREIQALEPNLPVPNIDPVTGTIESALYPARMGAWLLSIFGGLALLLAAVGIYGVLSFSISRRTREMGIRVALGAETRDVFLFVLREGMLLVGAGIVIGLAAGLAGARWLTSFLYGVPASDVATFTTVTMILLAVAFGACAIPAHRAMRVNPMAALRSE